MVGLVPLLQAKRSNPDLPAPLDCSHGEVGCQGRAVTFLFDCGHLFVPTAGDARMTRADQVKVGPLGPPRSGLTLS